MNRSLASATHLRSFRVRSSWILGVAMLLAPAAAAAPLTPGDLLAVVVMSPSPFPSYLVELTPDGSEVQTFLVPDMSGGFPRDVAVDAQGRAYVFDGEWTPYIATLDPASGFWNVRTAAGWGTSDANGHGAVAVAQGEVLVTDARTGTETTLSQGLIRFALPLGTGPADRPVVATDYRDVVTGLDGLVYALDAQGGQDGVAIDVLDPGSLARLRRVTVPAGLAARAIAVDASGRIFVASWQAAIHRLSPDGTLQASAALTDLGVYPQGLIDVDVNEAGQVILGSSTGGIILTTVTFDRARTKTINLGNYAVATYVGIVPTGAATPALRSSWGALKARFR